jgi:uncharacterized membrane protein
VSRPRAVIIAVIAVVVLAVAGAGVWWATRPESAEQAAERYLSALASGDADALRQLLPDDAQADEIIGALAGAEARIEDAVLEPASDQDGLRGFRATATLDEAPATVHFALAQEGGRWRLAADFLRAVTVQTTLGDSVRVGDAVLPLTPDGTVSLLPAVYPVSAEPADLLRGSTTVRVTSDAEQPAEVVVDAALAPEATALAQEQLDAYADACAQPATEVPAHCGLRVPWAADLTTLTSLTFRIEQYPAAALDAGTGTFAATGGIVVATATGESRAGGTGSVTYRADEWALRGSLAVTGGELVLSVD